jgi:hypothetical protein
MTPENDEGFILDDSMTDPDFAFGKTPDEELEPIPGEENEVV